MAVAFLILLYAFQTFLIHHCFPLFSFCTDYPCSGMLGMVSGQISDAQISASSYADRGWVAENARLLTGRSGWTGQQTKQPFRNEWLQVGLILNFECLMMGNGGVICQTDDLWSFFVSQILNPYIPAIVLCVMGFCFVSSQIVCLSVCLLVI